MTSASTTVRIDRRTHERLRALARDGDQSITDTLAEAVRCLRQERIGAALAGYEPTPEDDTWLYGHADG